MAQKISTEERTRRMVILIFCIIISVVAIIWAMLSFNQAKEIKTEAVNSIQKLTKDIQESSRNYVSVISTFSDYSDILGWSVEPQPLQMPYSTTGTDDRILSDFLLKYTKLFREKISPERFPEPRVVEETTPKGEVKRTEYPSLTLMDFFTKIEESIEELKQKKKQLLDSILANLKAYHLIMTSKGLLEKKAKHLGFELTPQDKEVKGIREAHNEAMAKIEKHRETIILETKNRVAMTSEFLDKLLEQVQTIKKLDEEASELTKINLTKKAELAQLEEKYSQQIKINEYKVQEAIEKKEEDGKVLQVDLDRFIVYIDLARKDRIFRGMKFKVFSLERGGIKEERGEIEIISVNEQNSVAAILKLEDEKKPIKAGDSIYSIEYERGIPKAFAFIGTPVMKYSWTELASFLKENGDIVHEQVTEDTHYVVVGSLPYDKNQGYMINPGYARAKEMGVRIITEKHLYDYLGLPWH